MKQTNQKTCTGIGTGPEQDHRPCLLLLLLVSTSLFILSAYPIILEFFTQNLYSSLFVSCIYTDHIDLQVTMIMP